MKALLAATGLSLLAVSGLLAESATIGVSAKVVNTCAVTTTALALSDYEALVANKSLSSNVSSGVTLACTRGAASSVGPGAAGDGSARRMRGAGSAVLTYELYKPSNTNPGGAGQSPHAGSHADTVVVTVNF